jgi:CHAD domain-containing protein
MTVRLPSDLLYRSAEEGSRLLALGYLEEIGWAERRLADPQDSEALHDFRVGLRRLRSCTRAYRSQLDGSISKTMRRQLRELTQATNPGRDTDVKLTWLHQQAERLGAGEAEGMGWLVGRLEGRKYEALERVTGDAARRFSKMATKFRRRLGRFQVQVRTGREQRRQSFGEVTGGLIQRHAAELAMGLQAVVNPEDVSEAHTARIRAKRLRYLLEPLGRRAPGAKGLVGRLKQLQDLLGSLHDMHVLTDEIESALQALSRSMSDRQLVVKPGLLALQGFASEQALESFAAFRAGWAEGRADRFLARVDQLGAHLSGPISEKGKQTVVVAPEVAEASVIPLPLAPPSPPRLQLQPRPRPV